MEQSPSMAHFLQRCMHGVVVAQCRCADPNKAVTVVECPENCGVRMLAEETMAGLPMENAAQQTMRRDEMEGARGRFAGHDPYREM